MTSLERETIDEDIIPPPREVKLKSPWVAVGTFRCLQLHVCSEVCGQVAVSRPGKQET
jgi:hypothetical protein